MKLHAACPAWQNHAETSVALLLPSAPCHLSRSDTGHSASSPSNTSIHRRLKVPTAWGFCAPLPGHGVGGGPLSPLGHWGEGAGLDLIPSLYPSACAKDPGNGSVLESKLPCDSEDKLWAGTHCLSFPSCRVVVASQFGGTKACELEHPWLLTTSIPGWLPETKNRACSFGSELHTSNLGAGPRPFSFQIFHSSFSFSFQLPKFLTAYNTFQTVPI